MNSTTPSMDVSQSKKWLWLLGLFLVVFIASFFALSYQRQKNQVGVVKTPTENTLAQYHDAGYPVTFQYPSSWKKEAEGERYSGKDGFFQVAELSGENLTLDVATRGEAFHLLKPYGAQPLIENITIGGKDARLILPAADQPKEMNGQSAALFPENKLGQGSLVYYLILWADKDHIREIAASILFLTDITREEEQGSSASVGKKLSEMKGFQMEREDNKIVLYRLYADDTLEKTGLEVELVKNGTLEIPVNIVVSPNKTMAVWNQWNFKTLKMEIFLADVDGKNPRKIAEQEVAEGSGGLDEDSLEWSDNGRYVMYSESQLNCDQSAPCQNPGDFVTIRAAYRVDVQTMEKTLISKNTGK